MQSMNETQNHSSYIERQINKMTDAHRVTT